MRKIIIFITALTLLMGCSNIIENEENEAVKRVCYDMLKDHFNRYDSRNNFKVISTGKMEIYKGQPREKFNTTEFSVAGKLAIEIKAFDKLKLSEGIAIEKGAIENTDVVFVLTVVKGKRDNEIKYWAGKGGIMVVGTFLTSNSKQREEAAALLKKLRKGIKN